MADYLRRNRVLLTSCGLLLLSLLVVSTSVRSPDQRDLIARALLDGLAPLQLGLAGTRAGAREIWSGYVNLVGLRRENELLRERVASLEQQNVQLEELERTNERLEELLQLRADLHPAVYGARVIGRDPLPWSRTFTVDRGERDGIRRGMAVLSPQGVVGQVIEVSRIAAQVLLLTDHNSGIDAVIQRSRARGIVQGALNEGCHMKYLRRGEDVSVGDRVITSGLDGIFPKGIPIGEVVEVSRRHRGLLQVALVQPSAALDRIEEVLIVDPGAAREDGLP